MLRAIIVDDEELSVKRLKGYYLRVERLKYTILFWIRRKPMNL